MPIQNTSLILSCESHPKCKLKATENCIKRTMRKVNNPSTHYLFLFFLLLFPFPFLFSFSFLFFFFFIKNYIFFKIKISVFFFFFFGGKFFQRNTLVWSDLPFE